MLILCSSRQPTVNVDMENISPALLAALRDLIGTHGKYHGQDYELIEVLEHEPAVVLLDCSSKHSIQNDMHGEAHRITNKTHTVSILSETSNTLHPVLEEFFSVPILSRLQSHFSEINLEPR